MMKELMFIIAIFLFIIHLAFAQMNMTPESKEEAENVAKRD